MGTTGDADVRSAARTSSDECAWHKRFRHPLVGASLQVELRHLEPRGQQDKGRISLQLQLGDRGAPALGRRHGHPPHDDVVASAI